MKKILTFNILIAVCITSYTQINIKKISDSLVKEGQWLYKSEMASWYGTDIFLEKYKNKGDIGGYFSYVENNVAKCIFFSKGEMPKVIGAVSFDSTYNTSVAKADLLEREFTKYERVLYTIRSAALKTITHDTLFRIYKNTELNLIPVISNRQKRVYVLTGPKENGVIIFGNDYVLAFDDKNNLKSKKQLHKNIIPIKFNGTTGDSEAVTTMHNHLQATGDFITATDICTLMLYEKLAKWQEHIVTSKNYISIWDCTKNKLTVLTKQAWDKIYKDQKKISN